MTIIEQNQTHPILKFSLLKKAGLVMLLCIFQLMSFTASATDVCTDITFTGHTTVNPICGAKNGSISYTIDNPNNHCVFFTLYHYESQVWYLDYNTTLSYNNLPAGTYKITLFVDTACDPNNPWVDCHVKSDIIVLACEPGCNVSFQFIDGIDESGCAANNGIILHNPLNTALPYTVEYTLNGTTTSAGPYTVDQTNFITNLAPGTYTNITLIDNDGCEYVLGNDIVIEEFTTGCSEGLPVQLISFTTKVVEGNQVRLEWLTASEVDNSHFIVERSIDAREYETIDIVKGKGTTNESTSYTITDEDAYYGYNYYRLKQVDYDNSFEYFTSESVLISPTDRPNILIYPNPVATTTNLRVISPYEENVDLEVVNSSGSVMKIITIEKGNHNTQLDLSGYPAGRYLIYTRYKGDRISVQNLVKVD